MDDVKNKHKCVYIGFGLLDHLKLIRTIKPKRFPKSI